MSEVVCEVCVDSTASVHAASAGGADRLELCTGLALGGLTPSSSVVAAARRVTDRPIYAMVRYRPGDFVLDRGEVEIAVAETRELRRAGVDGIVFGAVTPGGRIDEAAVARVVSAAGRLPVTFHRAFDHLQDRAEGLERLVGLGVARVLTSGGAARAVDAVAELKGLVEQAGDRIVVMPGAGVTPDNAGAIVHATGARELHFSASATRPGPMRAAVGAARMGAGSGDDLVRTTADVDRVRATVVAARGG